MSVLELVAEKHLGEETLRSHPQLRAALKRVDETTDARAGRERIASIVELCFEFYRETDAAEKENILRTLEEISANQPLELPTQDMEDWDRDLRKSSTAYAKAGAVAAREKAAFLKKYFSLRARAGLATQADVARKSGLSRSYVAVIETGEHLPQQKTLQKLARAFGVDVGELMP